MVLQLSVILPILLLISSIALPFFSSWSSAQEQILRDRWVEGRSDNFHMYSYQSDRQTNLFDNDLEVWRQVTSFAISEVNSFSRLAFST